MYQISEYKKRIKIKKAWQKVVLFLAAIVVFCTTYALILPAITLEKQAIYQKPEQAQASSYEKIAPIDLSRVNAVAYLIDKNSLDIMPLSASMDNNETDQPGIMSYTADSQPVDFRNLITGVTVEYKNNNNKWIELGQNATVKKGDQLRFKVAYKLPGQTLAENKDTIVYQLPSNINIMNEASGIVYHPDGVTKMGTYKISKDGKISITFNQENVDNNANKNQDIIGSVYIETLVNNISTSGKDATIQFTDDIIINFKIDEPVIEKSDLRVQKSQKIGANDEINGIINYTIEISSENGTGKEVILTDVMEGINLQDGSIKVVDGNNKSVNYTPNSKDNNNFNITLPKMGENSKYIITYTAKLPEKPTSTINVKNKAYAKSTKKDSETPIEGSSEVNKTFTQTYLDKSGELKGDKIVWTVIINKGGMSDLGGWTLSDNINGIPFTGPVNIKNSADKVVKWNVHLPYTFEPGMKEEYKITYETTTDSIKFGESYIKNEAILKPLNKDEIKKESSVSVGDNDRPLSKYAMSLVPNPGTVDGQKTANITWKVTVDGKKSGIPENWTLNDELKDNQWMTHVQMLAFKQSFDNAIKDLNLNYRLDVKTTDGKIEEWSPNNVNHKYKGYIITFSNALPKNTSFNFTYETTAPLGDGNKDLTFQNSININNKVHITSQMPYAPIVKKYDLIKNDTSQTEHNYYSEDMDKTGVLKWGITLSIPTGYQGGNLTVLETLPEGVDLKKLLIHPNGDSNVIDITENRGYSINNQTVSKLQIGQNITIIIPEALAQSSKTIKFDVYAQIKDNFEWSEEKGIKTSYFNNKVRVIQENGGNGGESEQTQKIIKDNSQKVLTKQTLGQENNVISYQIKVNPDGKDLLKDGDQLTIIDTVKLDKLYGLQVGISIVPNSVKVYHIDNQGNIVGDALAPNEIPYNFDISEEIINANKIYRVYTLKMNIPDSTPLLIEYKYKVNIPKNQYGEYLDLTNNVKLEGITSTNTESSSKINFQLQESGAVAATDGINLYKVDSNNYGIFLEGAQFKLYTYDQTQKKYVAVCDENNKPIIYTTTKTGVFLPNMTRNQAYYLEEITAPEGYMKREKPFYFYIYSSDTNTYPNHIPADFNGTAYRIGAFVYVPNEKESGKITVSKKWFSSDGITDITNTATGSISFDLIRKASKTPPITSSDTVSLQWQCLIYGSVQKIESNIDYSQKQEVLYGSTVKITYVAGTDQDLDKVKKYAVLANEKPIGYLERENASSRRFSYSFVITDDTILYTNIDQDWQFQDSSNGKRYIEVIPPTSSSDGIIEEIIQTDIILSKENQWQWSQELPKIKRDSSGNIEYYYTYYVKENKIDITNYITTYENNEGIREGIITIKNTRTKTYDYVLPETGGTGKSCYILGGLLLIFSSSIILLFRYKKETSRREEFMAP